MKEITRIHLAKIPYEIEIDAKKDLEKYLNALKKYADDSIFTDVEIRITEILLESGVEKNGIISKNEVEKIRAQVGEPEVFKGEDFEEETSEISATPNEKKKLYRVEQDGIFGGVAAGLGEYFGIEATWIRILFVILTFPSLGWMTFVYVMLVLIIPRAKNASDILRLRGESITAEKIRTINEEFDFEKARARDRKIVRIVGAIFGLGASVAAMLGLWVIFMGNHALNTMVSESHVSINENTKILLFALCNFAGLMFVIFNLALAHLGFTAKATRSHFIAIMMTFALGITSIIGVVTLMMDVGQKHHAEVVNSAKTTVVKIDPAKLSQIKSIENKTQFSVEYIVSDQRKVEISEYTALKQELAKNTKFDFEGETLRISSSKIKKVFSKIEDAGYKIRIYGPELSKALTFGDMNYEISKNQTLPFEVFVENDELADFEIRGAGTVENLKIFARNEFGEMKEVSKEEREVYEN